MKSVYKQNGITIDITEIQTILAKFRDITPNLMRKSLRRGFAAIGKEVKAIQKNKIQSIEGKRKVGIGFNKKGKAYMFVGPRRKATDLGTPSKYAHFVESGVKPHKIKVNRGHNAGRTFNHPGYKATPFVAPSYDAIRSRAQQMMIEAMETAIQETLKQ